MKQYNEVINGVRHTAWLDKTNAAYGAVIDNVLHLLYTDELTEKKGFKGSPYQKVIKKAKAKFGVRGVVEHINRSLVIVNGRLYEFELVAGKVSKVKRSITQGYPDE